MVSGIIAGIGVRYTRRIKWSSILGSLLFLLGMGLMIKFRTSLDNGHIGVIAAQVGKKQLKDEELKFKNQ